MTRRLMLISMVSLVLLIVLGNTFVANGQTTQSIAVAVKEDPAGGFSNADLNGRYGLRRLGIFNFELSNRKAEIVYGYVDFNGNGLWTGQFTGFESDGTSEGTTNANGTYSVYTDGSFVFNLVSPSGSTVGHISSNSNFIIMTEARYSLIHDEIVQGVAVLVKEPDSPLTLADINGTWQFRELNLHNFEDVGRSASNCMATIDCNNGNWSGTNACSDDTPEDTATVSGAYSINGNVIDFYGMGDPTVLLSAYLSKDGNTLITSKGAVEVDDIEQYIGVFVKGTIKTFTNADLSGTYNIHVMHLYDFDSDNREAVIVTGPINIDGVGNWTNETALNYNSKGESFSEGGFGTYSVNSDGSFTFIQTSDDPSDAFYGNISSDNNIITINHVQKTVVTSPPDKPNLLSPANGASGVSLTPTLQTGSFSDPDNGDTHLQTEWQISTMSDFSSTVLNEISTVHLTSLTVPHLTLNEGTTYYWRVRFQDSSNDWSELANAFAFTTLVTTNDQNSNGIPDNQENDTVDMDSDGTPDILQNDIKSLNTVVGEGQMGVSRKGSPNVTSIQTIESIDPTTISETAIPYSMKLGLFALSLNVANAGDAVQVTVYFSEAAPADAKWLIYDSINGWQDYSDHATFSTDRKSVILELKDGDYGDADGAANGVIVDPGGFGLASWIEGYVTDASTGQAITSAVISILNLTIKTMSDGRYLSMILPGTYSCKVSANGYQTMSRMVEVPEGDILSYNFKMTSGNSGGDCSGGGVNTYFPHVAVDSSWETEICIINKGAQSLSGELRAYDNSGLMVDSKCISLTSKARREIIIGNELLNPSSIGYLIFESDSQSLCGYTKFYVNGKYRVAIPAAKDVNSGDIYISHIASDNNWTTGISLLNTTSSSKTLDIEFDNGATKTVTIPANEHKAFTISGLFDGQSQAGINSAVIKNGSGIVGLEIFGTTENSGSSYLSGILLKDDTTSTIYYPHVASDSTWGTGIVAYNPSASSCDLTITPYDLNGTPLSPLSVTLSGKQKYIGTPESLNLPSGTAWFSIEAATSITGFELFTTKNGKLLGGYTGVGISGTDGVFAKIDRDGGTGIAFVNIESSAATVTMTAYDDNGSVIATETVNLAAHEKKVDIPSNLFSEDISTATYIAYSSTGNVVGFQLNVSSDGMMLDALPRM